jgi:hypothetical protein
LQRSPNYGFLEKSIGAQSFDPALSDKSARQSTCCEHFGGGQSSTLIHSLRAIEAERRATEARVKEVNIRVCEAEIALGHAEALVVSTESKLSDAEERADAAQTLAQEAGTALVRIEEAIRLHLFRAGEGPSSSLSAAA